MGKFKSAQTNDFRRRLTLVINKGEQPANKDDIQKKPRMAGDSSEDSGSSQISHLSLAHTNELYAKKKLDSENRPSKI